MKKLRMFMVMVLSVALFVLVGCGESKPEPKPENAVSLSDFVEEKDVKSLYYNDYFTRKSDSIYMRNSTYSIGEKDITPTMKDWFVKLDGIYFDKNGESHEGYLKDYVMTFALYLPNDKVVEMVVYTKKDANGDFLKNVESIYLYVFESEELIATKYAALDTKKAYSVISKLINSINKVNPN